MALEENFVTQKQSFTEKNLRAFQDSCEIATKEIFLSRNDSPIKKEQRVSYDEADQLSEDLAMTLMKETWNISQDE